MIASRLLAAAAAAAAAEAEAAAAAAAEAAAVAEAEATAMATDPAKEPTAPEHRSDEDKEQESAEGNESRCPTMELESESESHDDTEGASNSDLAELDVEDWIDMKKQMYHEELASLKTQLQKLEEGTLQEYQERIKQLHQQYEEAIENAELFFKLQTEQVERNYIKEKEAALKEFEDQRAKLKENLIAELQESAKTIADETLLMQLTEDSMEMNAIVNKKFQRPPDNSNPIPDKKSKPAVVRLNYRLTDEEIMEDLRAINELKSPESTASTSSVEHMETLFTETPAQSVEARKEDDTLYYDERCYHENKAGSGEWPKTEPSDQLCGGSRHLDAEDK